MLKPECKLKIKNTLGKYIYVCIKEYCEPQTNTGSKVMYSFHKPCGEKCKVFDYDLFRKIGINEEDLHKFSFHTHRFGHVGVVDCDEALMLGFNLRSPDKNIEKIVQEVSDGVKYQESGFYKINYSGELTLVKPNKEYKEQIKEYNKKVQEIHLIANKYKKLNIVIPELVDIK